MYINQEKPREESGILFNKKGWAKTKPLIHVDVGFLADDVRKTATNTLDRGQGEHNLLLAVHICVLNSENVLKLLICYQRLQNANCQKLRLQQTKDQSQQATRNRTTENQSQLREKWKDTMARVSNRAAENAAFFTSACFHCWRSRNIELGFSLCRFYKLFNLGFTCENWPTWLNPSIRKL